MQGTHSRGIFIATLLMIIQCSTLRAHAPLTVTLVDSVDRDAYLYQPFINALTAAGCSVAYAGLQQLIDRSDAQLGLGKSDMVFFIFGIEFLSGLNQKNRAYLCDKVLRLLTAYAQKPKKVLGLVFPPQRVPDQLRTQLLAAWAPVFKSFLLQDQWLLPGIAKLQSFLYQQGLPYPSTELRINSALAKYGQPHDSYNTFLDLVSTFLAKPLETRPLGYHTTLNLPAPGVQPFNVDDKNRELFKAGTPLFLLPLQTEASQAMHALLPYGVYWFNQSRGNHVFITNSSVLTFAGISENFHICPMHKGLRYEMVLLLERMVFELTTIAQQSAKHAFITTNDVLHTVARVKQTPTPATILHSTWDAAMLERSPSIHKKTAWMEIVIFDQPSAQDRINNPNIDQERAARQDKLIEYCYTSGLDSLWISFNPHIYYSPIGRLKAPEKVQAFEQALALFTKKLADGARTYQRPTPAVLVGFEIANNLYEPHLPKHYAIDLYENSYKDLPAPLDADFWNTEVIEPLKKFTAEWKRPEISHGIRLSGVVLDLEMYCRKQSGSFFTTMGCDGLTFNKFLKYQGAHERDVAVHDRALWLLNHKKGAAYFTFLEQQARTLGQTLRTAFVHETGSPTIMCYMPHIQISWFYKGLCQGLSTPAHPLYLLTFNSNFLDHEGWFERAKIPVYHQTVLMLSKLRTQDDFALVDYMLDYHHGLWLNRFSRFAEPKARDWTSIEQPGLPEAQYGDFMRYLMGR